MSSTKIEWTERTWNPITGCTKYSMGCENCYAEKMSRRLCAMNNEKYRNGFEVTLHIDELREPLKWKKPSTVFVCSMSDMFHKDVPFEFVDKIMSIIKRTPQHNYQLLTKRADRMAEYFKNKLVPKNVWIGVTVEAAKYKDRVDHIRDINASVKFISCEPLLDDIGEINTKGIDWIIVGGESGNCARPMKEEWVVSIKKQANRNNVAFFFKQWGTWGQDGIKRNKKDNGKLLQDRVFQAMPIVK